MSSFEQVKNLFEDSEITTEVVRKSIHMLIALVPLLELSQKQALQPIPISERVISMLEAAPEAVLRGDQRKLDAIDAALDIALQLRIPDDIGRAYVNKVDIEVWSGQAELALASAMEGMRVAAEWGVAASYGAYIGYGGVNAAFEAVVIDRPIVCVAKPAKARKGAARSSVILILSQDG